MRFAPTIILLLLLSPLTFLAEAQNLHLAVSSGTGLPGDTVTLDISLSEDATVLRSRSSADASVSPSAVQWTLNYSTTDFSALTFTDGPSTTLAEKSVSCSIDSGSAVCLVAGLNTNPIPNGVIATLELTISASTISTSSPIQLTDVVAADSNGEELSVTSSNGLVTIQQATTNAPPVAEDQAVTTEEDTSINITLQAADPEGDEVTFTFGAASSGNLTGSGANLTYAPNQDFNGVDSFTFTASDAGGGSDSGTVTITVTEVNDPPVASDQGVSTSAGTAIEIILQASDVDGDTLTFTHTEPSQGVLAGSGASLLYTPNENFAGTDTFTFTADDGRGGADNGTVTITLNSTNSPPSALSQELTSPEDVSLDITLQAEDPDGDTLTFSHSDPAHGVLTGSGANLTYTPEPDFFGSDSLSFEVDDGNGGTDAGVVTITITNVNDAPVAVSQEVATPADSELAIVLDADDADGDALSYEILSLPGDGSLLGTAPELTYLPNSGFQGTDSFTFQASDSAVASSLATVTITVGELGLVPDKPAVISSTTWMIDQNNDGEWQGPPEDRLFSFGEGDGIPVSGDWNGSGRASVGLFADGFWLLDFNENDQWDGAGVDLLCTLGQAGDVPVAGDWTGSGRTSIGVFRDGQWLLDMNGNCLWDGEPLDHIVALGKSGDIPVIGDWNGTGKDLLGVFDNGMWQLDFNGNCNWDGPGGDREFSLGKKGDTPVVGDWDGSGTTKLGVFSGNGRWQLDLDGNGAWEANRDIAPRLGAKRSIPVVGDWNGSGTTKIGVYSAGTWQFDLNGNGSWDGEPTDRELQLGGRADTPIAARW